MTLGKRFGVQADEMLTGFLELEAVIREVEDALNRDDFQTACSKSSDGLSRFPGERTLLKLQVLAEKQRQVEERKRFVDEQLAVARNMLQEKRNEELLKSLEGTPYSDW